MFSSTTERKHSANNIRCLVMVALLLTLIILSLFFSGCDEQLSISILGDSMSTYRRISNSSRYNSTLTENTVFYPNSKYDGGNIKATQTWWQLVARALGGKILVNNSCSGAKVTGKQTYATRSVNLHNKRGNTPDVIIILIGENDFGHSVSLNAFEQAYRVMLRNVTDAYGNAQIYCCTFLPDRKRQDTTVNDGGIDEREYLSIIQSIATEFGVKIIDLYNDSGITQDNIDDYTLDRLHPNARGMKLIADCVVAAISSYAKQLF